MSRTPIRLSIALLGGIGLSHSAQAGEEKIPLDKVPAAVMKAAKEKFPKAEIKGAAKEEEDGKVLFELMMAQDGRGLDVVFASGGAIEAVEKEIEWKDLPAPVSAALSAKYPKAKFARIEEIAAEGKTLYEVNVEVTKSTEILLDASGKAPKASKDEDEDDDEKEMKKSSKKGDHHEKEKKGKKKKDKDGDKKGKKDKKKKKDKDDDDDDDEKVKKGKKKDKDDD